MIRLDVVQGSDAWIDARLGIPTASKFDRIISNKQAKFSDSAPKYAYQLIAEQLLGAPLDDAGSAFIERGSVLERKAVSYYEMRTGNDTEAVGFLMRDDRRAGASPDRLVGNDGLLEIKVPGITQHLMYLAGADTIALEYRAQCQGQLWVAEREWLDSLSYSPDFPSGLVRVTRDEDFIKKLAAAVKQFNDYVDETKLKLQRYGLFPEFERAPLRVVA